MQADFQRSLIWIVVIGTAIMVIGGGLLVFAFRSLGKVKEGDKRHIILFAVAIGFILLACAGLLIWSDLQAPE